MDVSRSRRQERYRSPLTSRSRSRSYKSRRGRRSSSKEDRRANLSPKYHERKPSYLDKIRNRSISPAGRSPPSLRFDSSSERRLKKPEIYSIVDSQPEPNRFISNADARATNHTTITLNERFNRLTQSGTALYNKRFPGRSWDLRQLPHLILTNNMQLPPATLIRQAKTISVVVERKFPPGRKKSHFDGSQTGVCIPRRPNEGIRPVFARPEMKFYRSAAEEAEIPKRLLECISSPSKPQHSERSRSRDTKVHPDQTILAPGRFYGSRVDESYSNARSARPIDPLETPRNPSYFMHDTRDDTDLTSRRNWRTRFPNTTVGYRRDFRDRSPGSPIRPFNRYDDVEPEDKWKHDKFEELETGTGDTRTVDTGKSVPKPVPAPKPILWSTIGKEVLNGDAQSGAHASDQSTAVATEEEEVRIDAEPVLGETMEEN